MFAKQAVSAYHSFKDVVWKGSLYRLVNPHQHDIASLLYVNDDKSKAVFFNYLVNTRYQITATERPIVLEGLDPKKKYTVKEINLYPGTTSGIDGSASYSGDFLMKVGFNPDVTLKRTSVVVEINEVK